MGHDCFAAMIDCCECAIALSDRFGAPAWREFPCFVRAAGQIVGDNLFELSPRNGKVSPGTVA